jgi:hypothetical protein
MPPKDYRKHEVNFCSEVSKWADSWFQTHPALPFGSSEIEEFAKGSAKRSDLRIYERKESGRGKLLVSGEVKLPGTPLGRSPFDPRADAGCLRQGNKRELPLFLYLER